MRETHNQRLGAYKSEGRGMGKHEKVMEKILRGTSDANIAFDDIRGILLHLGSMNGFAEVTTFIERKVLRKR
jgi:hypothetical protein